jgi:hypothetical protein
MNRLQAALALACIRLFTLFAATAAMADDDVYARPESWLCRPGATDLCAAPTVATVVAADGSRSVKTWEPNPDAAIDCFYVYPTVSEDPNGNSGMVPGPGEKRAITQQFAPFASVCRPYAPMYRQVTLAGLSSKIEGKPIEVEQHLGSRDIRAAWKHYLRYDNHGRGVVLIGHSQGARILADLIQDEMDGRPEQALLAGALLLGFNVQVPIGADVGGSFRTIPLCRKPGQVGCVVAYESFRADSPPKPDSRFGSVETPGMEVACTDPTALSATPLEPILSAQTNLFGKPSQNPDWVNFAETIDTPFVSLIGAAEVHCVHNAAVSYLAVNLIPPTAASGRPADIPGDLIVKGRRLQDWGLHLIDMNIAMGNLIDWVGRLHKPEK